MTNGSSTNAPSPYGSPLKPDHWDKPPGAWNYMQKTPAGSPDIANVIDDPVQGNLLDCYFFAPLSAISVKTPSDFVRNLLNPWSANPWTAVKLWVIDPKTNLLTLINSTCKPPGAQFSNELALNALGKLAYTPFTNPLNTNILKNEAWVAFYEKAYAISQQIHVSPYYSVACGGPGHTTPYQQWGPYNPDMDVLSLPGCPLYALMTLTGKNFSYGTTAFYTQDIISNGTVIVKGLSDPGVWAQNVSNPNNKQLFSSLGGWALYPAVAWTYFSPTGGAGRPTTPPPGIVYDTELLVANHAYAVLGNWWNGTDEYVVLRNPFGPPLGQTAYALPGVWQNAQPWPSNDTNAINIGQAPDSPPNPLTAGRGKPDGVFAMHVKEFLTMFEGIGWVQ